MSSRSIVGLEIADGWVRGVELVRPGSRRPTVRAVGEVALPPDAARDSEVLDPGAVAVALKQLWAKAGFGSKEVILGVGNRRILVREHVAPALPLSQIKQALRYQVQDLLPVPVDQAVLDFYPVEPAKTANGEDGVFGLLVSAVTANVEGLLAPISEAGLRVVGVDLAPFGLARAAARVARPDARALVIHIGAATSWFVVIEDGVCRFVRIVPGGIPTERPDAPNLPPSGPDATVAAPQSAAALSPFPGAAAPAPTGARAQSSAVTSSDIVLDFLTLFTETRDFYERAHPEKPIGQVLITGEGALHPQVAPRLGKVTDVEVITFGLSEAFDVAGATIDPTHDRITLTAAGAAIGGEV